VIGSSQTQRDGGPLRTGGVVGAISAADALRLARQTGIKLDIDVDQVSLEWPDTSAAQAVIELLRGFKPEVAELLSAERRAVVTWINEKFQARTVRTMCPLRQGQSPTRPVRGALCRSRPG
jgi:hypothetical protein